MANFCPNCGNTTNPEDSNCSNCGANLFENHDNQSTQPNNNGMKGLVIAIIVFSLLLFICGFIGIKLIVIPNMIEAQKEARSKACYSNQRVLMGAVEMYNMDVPDKDTIHELDNKTIEILIEKHYLKPLTYPEPECSYISEGDLLKDAGYIRCKFHGSVPLK